MTPDDRRSPLDCVVELLRRRRAPNGAVVVDLASHDRSMQDALSALGLGYLAAGPDALPSGLRPSLADRPVAAVVLGDAPGRVQDIGALLDAVRRFCLDSGHVPLVVHVPNVTHVDVGAKLLMGRWDTVPGGIVSSEHVRHFCEGALTSLMATHGFAQHDIEDLPQPLSDQHFPGDAVPLERTTLIGAQLTALREMSGASPFVTHFVRLYEVSSSPAHRAAGDRIDDAASPRPFLSVLLRTQGKRWETIQESLLCLAAQSCDDFEVLLLLHDGAEGAAASLAGLVAEFHLSFARRVRIVEVHGGGRSRPLNEGALAARGEYLAMLDDDDLVFSNWVESFREGATRGPGHVVRVPVASQLVDERAADWDGGQGYEVIERPRLFYALEFDHVDHLADNRTPNNGYAVPRSFVVDLGQYWDESLPVLEDWDHLLRAASMCGVVSVPIVTGLMRSWSVGENSKSAHSEDVWETTRRRIVERFDSGPLVLDLGSFSKIRNLVHRTGDATRERAEPPVAPVVVAHGDPSRHDLAHLSGRDLLVIARHVAARRVRSATDIVRRLRHALAPRDEAQ